MDRLPKKNLAAKLFALLLAIVLWVYVMNEQNPFIETYLEVPLDVRGISTSLTAMNMPEQIQVKVRGPRSAVIGLSVQDVKAFIDGRGLAEGKNTVKVHVSAPAGFEVEEINPDQITFNLERVIRRRVPVEVRVSGTPPDGMTVGNLVPAVSAVTVEGPKSLVENVEKAVARVDVSDQVQDFSANAELSLLSPGGKKISGLTITPPDTNVNVAILRSLAKKTVDVKFNATGELPKGFVLKQITTTPPKVEISGPRAALEKIDSITTEPINLNGVDKDTDTEIKLQPPEGITLPVKTVIVHIHVAKQ
jgi:YbbR domain-containing protein